MIVSARLVNGTHGLDLAVVTGDRDMEVTSLRISTVSFKGQHQASYGTRSLKLLSLTPMIAERNGIP